MWLHTNTCNITTINLSDSFLFFFTASGLLVQPFVPSMMGLEGSSVVLFAVIKLDECISTIPNKPQINPQDQSSTKHFWPYVAVPARIQTQHSESKDKNCESNSFHMRSTASWWSSLKRDAHVPEYKSQSRSFSKCNIVNESEMIGAPLPYV